jgi:hypothetical protein
MLNDIYNAISNFSLFDVGAALIGGMIEGVRSKAAALIAAAVGVVQGAIDAAKALLGIGSPSRVFRGIGVATMLGMVEGIRSMEEPVVGAIDDVMAEAAAAAIEQSAIIAEHIMAIIRTIAALGSMRFGETLAADVRNLSDSIRIIVAEMKILAEMYADPTSGLASAKAVLDALKPVFDGINAAADAILAVAAVASVNIGNAAQLLSRMIDQLVRALAWMVDQLPAEMLASVAAQAENLTAALSPWTAATEAVAAIASVAGVRIEDAAQRLIWMVENLIEATSWLVDYLPAGMLSSVAIQAESVVAALSPWTAAAEAVAAIASVAGVRIEEASQRLIWMVEELIEAISWLVDHLPSGLLTNVAAQAGAVTAALSPWTAAAEAVAAIASVAGVRIEEASQRLIWMVEELIEATSWLVNHLPPGMLASVAAQAAAVTAAMSPWTAAAEAVLAIASVAGVRIEDAAQRLIWMVEELIEATNWLINHLPPGMLASVAAQAAAVTAALSPWSAAAEAVLAIASVVGVRIEDAAQRLIWMVEELIEATNWLVNHLPPGMLANVAAQAGMLVAALEPWEAAAEAVKNIADVAGLDISTAMVDLRNAIAAMMTSMAEIAADLQSGGITSAVVFAGQLEAIAVSIEEAVSTLYQIVEYQGGEITAAMAGFLADVTHVVDDLAGAGAIMVAGNATAQTIKALGLGIGIAISEGMAGAVNVPTGMVPVLQATLVALTGVFAGIQAQFTAMKAAAWHFGYDWVSNIIAGMSERLDDLEELLAYIRGLFPSSPAKYGPFQDLPEGLKVSDQFVGSMIGGLQDGVPGVSDAMGTLRNAFDAVGAFEAGKAWVTTFAAGLQNSGGKNAILMALDSIRQVIDNSSGQMIARAFEAGQIWVRTFAAGLQNSGGKNAILMALDSIRQMIDNMTGQMIVGAFEIGQNWISMLIDGISSRLGELEAMMAYVHELTSSGTPVPPGLAVAAVPAGITSGGYDRFQSSQVPVGMTININNPTVRSDQDIDRIAAAVGDVLARQASTNSRMGRL